MTETHDDHQTDKKRRTRSGIVLGLVIGASLLALVGFTEVGSRIGALNLGLAIGTLCCIALAVASTIVFELRITKDHDSFEAPFTGGEPYN
jgi:hypothetical protein